MNLQKNLPKRPALTLTVLSTALMSLLFTTSAQADGTDQVTKSIEEALKFGQADAKYGQIKFDLRFRYENVDTQNPKLQTANAATARLRLGYLTPAFQGLQGYAEYQGNQDIVANDYNSTRNGKTRFATIADPQQNELSQLWLSYKGIPDTEVKVGRQRVQINNQRFIGSVSWRQMERTFDGLVITNTSLPNTTIVAGYLLKQQNTDATVQGMQLPFANISYKFDNIGSLTSYMFLYDANERHQDSSQTYGVRFDGSRKITDDVSLLYTAEYANQGSYIQSPVVYHADYYHFIGGANVFGITAKAGMEQMDGKGANKTFDTPLAAIHGFDGWADMFLTTPNAGLRNIYGVLEGEVVGVKLTGVYRDFSDDTSKVHYGKEWDFMASKEFVKHYTLFAKYAYFDAAPGAATAKGEVGAPGNNPFAFDTQKFWFGASVNY
jgi:hypothetical protein